MEVSLLISFCLRESKRLLWRCSSSTGALSSFQIPERSLSGRIYCICSILTLLLFKSIVPLLYYLRRPNDTLLSDLSPYLFDLIYNLGFDFLPYLPLLYLSYYVLFCQGYLSFCQVDLFTYFYSFSSLFCLFRFQLFLASYFLEFIASAIEFIMELLALVETGFPDDLLLLSLIFCVYFCFLSYDFLTVIFPLGLLITILLSIISSSLKSSIYLCYI